MSCPVAPVPPWLSDVDQAWEPPRRAAQEDEPTGPISDPDHFEERFSQLIWDAEEKK